MRYMVLEFAAVRAAALRGYPYCDIITKGCRLIFWGDRPGKGYGDITGFDLVLQLNPRHSLQAVRQ